MKTIMLIVLILTSHYAYSQHQDTTNPSFSGSIINENGEKVLDSLDVHYHLDCYTPAIKMHTTIRVKTNAEGDFKFDLPKIYKPAKMAITIKNAGKWTNITSKAFYVEPGDNINFKIYKSKTKDFKVKFSGINSAKYNLTRDFDEEEELFVKQDVALNRNKFKDSTILEQNILGFSKIIDRFIARRDSLFVKYSDSLTPDMRILAKYTFNTSYIGKYVVWFIQLWTGKAVDNIAYQKLVKKYWDKYSDTYSIKEDKLAPLASGYLLNLNAHNQLKLMIENERIDYDAKELYNYSKKTYAPNVRDIILGHFFLSHLATRNAVGMNSKNYDSLLNDAIPLIKSKQLSNILQVKTRLKHRSKFLDSEFFDSNNQKVNTKSLLGKVFFLDVWFTGCTGCATFHKDFRKDVPIDLLKNPNFVYLSVNIDSSRDEWLSSIKSDIYTSEEYLNVWSGTKFRAENPIFKYYDIHAFPFLLLVDQQGLIVSPFINGVSSTKEIFKLINKTLAKVESR